MHADYKNIQGHLIQANRENMDDLSSYRCNYLPIETTCIVYTDTLICLSSIIQHVLLILTAVLRRFGEYWRSLETRSTASGGIRLWEIWLHDSNKVAVWLTCIGIRCDEWGLTIPIKLQVCYWYLVPRMSFDLRELEFCVIRVHAFDLFSCWGT